jgi:hypothetical protein
MAEPSSGYVASPSNGTMPAAPAKFASINDNNYAGQPATRQPQGISFQAVNARPLPNSARLGDAPPTAPSQPGTTTPAVAPSEPQTAGGQPSSNAQHPASHVDGPDGTMAEPATYGTRSRNRTGNARPNYAEDQEMDFDFTSAATTTTTKKKAAHESSAAASSADARRPEEFARHVDRPKDLTPVAASGAAATSKKRKAVGGMLQQSQTPPASTIPAPSVARKSGAFGSTSSTAARETNMMTFTKHRNCLNKKGELIADDGTKLCVNGKSASPWLGSLLFLRFQPTPRHTTHPSWANRTNIDHVYLVCEPPGDPYYLCRIMEFLHVDSDNPNSPIDSLRVNWYYRPRDVQRFNSDSRLVYATMHSDMCPITSLRGKCTIKHKSEIQDLDAYRKQRDTFYFSQVFDRFIRRWYECIPVQQIINVPEKVKKALDERWKFIVVEIGRVKELTSAVKTCKRCAKYCASHDSVDCAICKNSYHMNCVQPPLPKKPSRGFAWACGPCSRASERKMEARNTPNVSGDVTEAEEEYVEEEPPISNDSTRAPSPSGEEMIIDEHPATQAEIALAKMWPMRYLGIHCRVEDALQYDDRAIYPRASSRLGPRHQANVNVWHGRPVELVKPAEIKRRYAKNTAGHKKEGKLTKETIAALEADREEKAKRPKWVQDEPPGYVARGEDYPNDDPRCTAKLLWKLPEGGTQAEKEKFAEDYHRRVKPYSRVIGVPPFGVNFLDKAFELLCASNYNTDEAIDKLKKIDRKKDLHEPVLTKADLVKFEEGVAKYGSEHRLIRMHMKSQLPHSDVVRFYYLWKKTPKGKEIWGNYGGRKGAKRKIENDSGAKLQAEVAHDADDSAFDNDKAIRKNRSFICKFCNTTHARQWRRAPGVSSGQTVLTDAKSGNKDKKERLLLALCLRCAGLWRKYAIQWEDIEEVTKKVNQGGGRAWKKRIDEELLRELIAANEAANTPPQEQAAAIPSIEQPGEPPKKKSKTDTTVVAPPPEPPKKKEKPPPPPKEPSPPPPPIIPNQPVWKVLPCAVCKGQDDTIACAHCKLTVHRRCYGLSEDEGVKPDGSVYWVCEQCQNDRHPEVSTDYACCLCLTEETQIDLVEPPKVSHKKKTDREREKERMEKELADSMRAEYRSKQLSQHRPPVPREPLKKTTGNNWVHVYCAVWMPEIRFSDAKKLEVAEGFQLIPQQRYEAVCKLCKNKDHNNKVREDAGACVSCFQCQATFHASCAFEAGYQFGFDVTPVKSSRKDQVTTAKLREETGLLQAGIWCKEHVVKSIIHPINERVDESGKTALQAFVENYKQADLALTGTVRKADLAQQTKAKGQQATATTQNGDRRASTSHSIAAAVRRGARTTSIAETKGEAEDGAAQASEGGEDKAERRCVRCKVDVTPRWHPVVKEQTPPKESTAPPPPAVRSPPRRRLSMTLGEYTDMQRQLSQEGNGVNGASDTNGTSASGDTSRPAQNIRFMPPGASGRAWDGMPDRYGPRPAVNGEPHTDEQGHAAQAEAATNGAAESASAAELPASEENKTDEGFHSHALPRYQNPASNTTTPAPEAETKPAEEAPQEWLCHKCFIRKKLHPEPTPPPEPAPEPKLSPPRQFPLQLDWIRPPAPPSHGRDAPIRMPWDEPPRATPPAPPSYVNGIGPQPPNFGTHVPPQGSGYPPYGAQPNGYHAPPPPPPAGHGPPPPNVGQPQHPSPHGVPPPGPPMHERQPSYGYGPPPPHLSTGPPAYPTHPGSRPPAMPGYSTTSQPMPNGMPSPHGVHQHMPSPGYAPPGMPPQHAQYPPRRTESPFTSQLPPIGQPLHSSPQTMFNRPDALTHGPPPPMQQQLQQPQTTQPPPGPAPPPVQHQHQQTQTPQPPNLDPALANAGPPPAQSYPDNQQGTRPTTPREHQTNGVLGPGGASASPSLRNLLH